MPSFKLAIVAGHYMNTPGKRCDASLDPNQTREWWLNDRVVDYIIDGLSGYDGIDIRRLDDPTGKNEITLKERTDAANAWKADFYLSIHHNAGINGGTGGGIVAFVYSNTTDAVTLAWQKELYNALIAKTGLKGNRSTPLAKSNLHECRETSMPAVLLELGFMDSKTDVPIILTDAFAKKCAQACVEVIVKRAKLTKKATTTTGTTVKTYKVVTVINKYATAADAKAKKNTKSDKLTAGTYYIFTKYPDGVDGMLNITTDKTGASAGSWINPTENVVATTTTTSDKLYRVRKSKDDAKTQAGAFSSLENAKDACQKAGAGYHVFDWNYKIVYSYTNPVVVSLSSIAVTTKPTKTTYTVGDKYDGTGLVITAIYSDKSTKVVTGYSVSGFSSAKAGTSTVNVTFEGKATTFTVTIKEKATATVTEVYDLDYPEKNKIVDKSISRTNTDCVKAIKKIITNNKSFDVSIAKAFFDVAPMYGIDPLMAIAQSCLETGWFKYTGSAVTAEHHNYCGLGVTTTGKPGAIFDSIEDGVHAQLQHLYAYGCKTALPAGVETLDPRFSLVTRGIATYWQQLAGRWACPGYDKNTYDTPEKAMAANNTYGQKIRTLYNQIIDVVVTEEDVQKYFAKDPQEETPAVNTPTTDVTGSQADEQNTGRIVDTIIQVIKKLLESLVEIFRKGTK